LGGERYVRSRYAHEVKIRCRSAIRLRLPPSVAVAVAVPRSHLSLALNGLRWGSVVLGWRCKRTLRTELRLLAGRLLLAGARVAVLRNHHWWTGVCGLLNGRIDLTLLFVGSSLGRTISLDWLQRSVLDVLAVVLLPRARRFLARRLAADDERILLLLLLLLLLYARLPWGRSMVAPGCPAVVDRQCGFRRLLVRRKSVRA